MGKGYRTIIVNILMAVASVVALYGITISPEQIELISGGIVTMFTVGNMILRAVTTTPIGRKD